MKKTQNKRWLLAFSLTEVLAVSAIVTSLPTGAYMKVQQKAHETECKSNLQQIGVAIVAYQTGQNAYPKAAFFPKDPANGEDSIVKILADSDAGIPAQMWICPAAPEELAQKGLTFVYNDEFGGRASLPDPTRAWLMIEVNCVSNKVPPPHPAGYNILFADGHVVSSRQLPSSITSKQKASIEGLLRQAGPVRSLALAK